jgi:hypothetical protein
MRYLFILFLFLLNAIAANNAIAAFPVSNRIDNVPIAPMSHTAAPGPTAPVPGDMLSLNTDGSNGVLSLFLALTGMAAFLAAVGTVHPLFFALGIIMGAIAVLVGMSAKSKMNAGLAKAGTILGIIDIAVTVAAAVVLLIRTSDL